MGKRTKNVVIRRCNRRGERPSSSYAITRQNPTDRSIAGKYRFAKTSVDEAETFTEEEARKVIKSLSRKDCAGSEPYSIVTLG